MIDYRDDNRWTVYIHIVPKEVSGHDWDKYYVGITSQNPERRWKNGNAYKYHNSHFARAIQKYSWDNIRHEIVAEHLTKNEATSMEIILINKLNSDNSTYGYNKTKGGEGVSGVVHIWSEEMRNERSIKYSGENNPYYGKKHSQKTKQLISKNHYDCSGGNNVHAKKVFLFTENGEYINNYPSTLEASQETKINRCVVISSISNKRIINGFILCYENEVNFNSGIYTLKNKDVFREQKRRKEVFLFDCCNQFIRKFDSCVEASNFLKISKTTVATYARNKQMYKNTYNFRYKKDVKESDENLGSFIIL